MENITPENLFMLIGFTILLGVASMVYDGRHHIARWWQSVRPAPGDYVQHGDREPAHGGAEDRAGGRVAATDNDARNLIATGSNARNEVLTRNERLRVQAEVIADLMDSDSLYIPDGKGGYKKLGQTTLIKLATGLSPNGRPDSDYAQLRAELEEIMRPTMTVTEGGEVRSIAK